MSKLSAVEAKAFLKKNEPTFFYTFSTQGNGVVPFCRGEVKADGSVTFVATPPWKTVRFCAKSASNSQHETRSTSCKTARLDRGHVP